METIDLAGMTYEESVAWLRKNTAWLERDIRLFMGISHGLFDSDVVIEYVDENGKPIQGESLKHLPGQHDQETHGNWADRIAGAKSTPIMRGFEQDSLPLFDWFYNDFREGERTDPEDCYKFGADINFFTAEERADQKDEIAARLAEETGLTYDQCNKIVESWAKTANDEHYTSLLIQESAAELFGGKLSPWQQEKLSAFTEARENNMRWIEEHREELVEYGNLEIKFREMLEERDTLYAQARRGPIDVARGEKLFAEIESIRKRLWEIDEKIKQDVIDSGYSDNAFALDVYYRSPLVNHLGELKAGKYTSEKEAIKAVLRASYNWTQDLFKKAGIKELVLYRGITRDKPIKLLQRGTVVDVTANAVESWTLHSAVADMFKKGKAYRYVFGMRIPVERVISSSRSGWGCLAEWEFLVINGAEPDPAGVVDYQEP